MSPVDGSVTLPSRQDVVFWIGIDSKSVVTMSLAATMSRALLLLLLGDLYDVDRTRTTPAPSEARRIFNEAKAKRASESKEWSGLLIASLAHLLRESSRCTA